MARTGFARPFSSRSAVRAISTIAASVLVGAIALSASPLPAFGVTSIGDLVYAGERKDGTRLKFQPTDQIVAQVDVGSGNLYVSVKGIALVGVKTKIQTGAFYNSLAVSSIGTGTRLGRGWGLDLTPSINLKLNADNSVTYTGPGGLSGVFPLKSGSTTTYDSPKWFTTDLVKTTSPAGWTLTDHQSKSKQTFNSAGELVSREDRDGNKTQVNQVTGSTSSFPNVNIVAPAGPTAGRTINVTTDASGATKMEQINGTNNRHLYFFRNGSGDVSSYQDLQGRPTNFYYDTAGRMTSIQMASSTYRTDFAYDSSGRVISIRQVETSSGGPGDSWTRLAYVAGSPDKAYVADPNTNQSLAVTAVPNTTYELNSNKQVEKATDPEGRERSKTYTSTAFDTASTSVGKSTDSEGQLTRTNTFGSNGGESMTKSATNNGLESTMSYANTSGPAQYQPTGAKDDGGTSSTYTYSGSGNPLTSADGDTPSAQAKLDYNTNNDGTIVGAAAPTSTTNKTVYAYTDKQITTITPKTGTSLGVKTLTYDAYGRTKTVTNGRGSTTVYDYDDLDRVTTATFKNSSNATTGTVSYLYDSGGRNYRRTDPNSITNYTYDQLGRMTARNNDYGGGTIVYKYDKKSQLIESSTDSGGTNTYSYDLAGNLTSVTYPFSGSTQTMRFRVDKHSRRAEAWLATNSDNTVWKAHYKNTFNKNGRVIRLLAEVNTGSGATTVIDNTYCYKIKYNATTAPTGIVPGNDCTNDDNVPQFSKLQWKKDKDGTITQYDYTAGGRLDTVKRKPSGGSYVTDYDYNYNKNGARTVADNPGTANDLTLTFNDESQITTTGYTFDGAGNLTAKPGISAIGYNDADQMTSVTKSGTTYAYTYAGTDNNELLEQEVSGSDYFYAYGRESAQGVPTVEMVHKGTGTADILNDPKTGQPLMIRTSAGTQSMYINDGVNGSPLALLNASGSTAVATTYDPYGLPTVGTGGGTLDDQENPFTFAGGVQDRVTGWVHYGARYYDPITGTWTQRDTLDTPLDLANANRYAYAGGDPVNNVDPTGRENSYAEAYIFTLGAISVGTGIAAALSGPAAPVLLTASIITGVAATELGALCLFIDGDC